MGDEFTPEIRALMERYRQHQAELERVGREVAVMVVKGRSRADEVEVSVRGTGRVAAIHIDPETMRHYDAESVGLIVTEAVNTALANLAKVSKAKYAPLLEIPSM